MNYDAIASAPRSTHPKGYVYVYISGRGHVREHIAIAEVALGHRLPEKAVVHHVNEDTGCNKRANLVICQDEAYHKALHLRMRTKAAGGDPWLDRICVTCRAVKPIFEFHRRGDRPTRECKSCVLGRAAHWRANNREAINTRQRSRRNVL